VTLSFDPGGKDQQIILKDLESSGFELVAADGRIISAKATVKGNVITLSCKDLLGIDSVRYAWADNPPATLFNTAGLLAAPFKKSRN
jgi:sialate O-acetylesterase